MLFLLGISACGAVEKSATSSTTTAPIVRPPGKCSAQRLGGLLKPEAGVPSTVAATRERIGRAAVACDYDALGRLASEGAAPFTFTYGDATRAETYWRNEELTGARPLSKLVKILSLEPATRRTGEETQFVWPAAYAYDSWVAVPDAQKDALRAVYTPPQIAEFRDQHSYIGYRVGISATGEWLFFVAGD
jgi:hypothetical protein